MQKDFTIVAFFLLVFIHVHAQNNQWAWMGGDTSYSFISDNSVYGIRGVANGTNKPGGKATNISWRDANGNFWLFGGNGYYSAAGFYSGTRSNDLWRYNPATNEWTWMHGENTYFGKSVYGTLGIAADSNTPGARDNSVSWTDINGNLWLFGGHTTLAPRAPTLFLNDLWKYNPATNQWTWMAGNRIDESQNGMYGVKGVSSANNKPGGRSGSISWTDKNNNLWLFGGGTLRNDLWKYNIGTNQWTWVSGDSIPESFGVYGTMGISSSSNKPGGRNEGVSWKDCDGNFWLFGGAGYAENSYGGLNDLWKYNPSINEWTWMNGDKAVNRTGIYGTKGIPSSANSPGGRVSGSSWIDGNNNLWLFGGYDKIVNRDGYFNNLWKFNTVTNEWTWVSGDSVLYQKAVYGTKSLFAPDNTPSARLNCASWIDENETIWLFGGFGILASSPSKFAYLNDLWKFNTGIVSSSNNLGVLKVNGSTEKVELAWETSREVNISGFDIERKGPNESTFKKIGNVPSKGNMNAVNSYQFADSSALKGNNYEYRIKQVNKCGQFYFSNIVAATVYYNGFYAAIKPNPSRGISNLTFQNLSAGNAVINLFNALGQKLATINGTNATFQTISLPVTTLPAGTYLVEILLSDNKQTLKLLIQ